MVLFGGICKWLPLPGTKYNTQFSMKVVGKKTEKENKVFFFFFFLG